MSKIVFFEYIHHFGGAQRSTLDVIKNLQEIGHQVTVVDPVGKVMPFKEAVCSTGADYISYNRDYNFVAKKNIKRAFLIRAYTYYLLDVFSFIFTVLRIKPDVVFTNSKKSIIPLVLGSLLHRYNRFFYLRGITEKPLDKFVKQNFSRCFDKIIVQAPAIKRYLISNGISEMKIEIVQNALSDDFLETNFIPDFEIEKYDGSKIVVISTITPMKGYLELIKAASILKNNTIDFKIYIAGDFIDKKFERELKMEIFKEGVEDVIVFLGYRKDVGTILQAADLFVLPSYAEGTPRSLLEAMALGKAVVVSAVGGIPDIICDKNNGVLISPRNVEQLSNAMRMVLLDKQFANRIGLEAKKMIKTNFTMKNQKHLLFKIFK